MKYVQMLFVNESGFYALVAAVIILILIGL